MDLIKKYKSDILLIVAISVIAAVLSYNFSILFVNGESMSPTYHDRDVVLLNKSHNTKNGQIVVFKSPKSWGKNETNFIKRIIASPGDVVEISNDDLLVNGELITNISEKKCELNGTFSFEVDKDHYLVVGDNHANSNDSLAQMCSNNEEFLVPKDNFLIYGDEMKVWRKSNVKE